MSIGLCPREVAGRKCFLLPRSRPNNADRNKIVNSAFDFAEAGIYATEQALASANIIYAGSGDSLQTARRDAVRQSGYVRLALVCAAGTHTLKSVAGAGNDVYPPDLGSVCCAPAP